jgi:SAM-dependent methyltransferase
VRGSTPQEDDVCRLIPAPFRPALFDFMARPMERKLGDIRRRLLGDAAGATVEIGAGTGANLPHYGSAVSRLALVEPDRHMARRLRRRAAEIRPSAEVVEATAESLPFEDGSVDTAVVTAVLCTVRDPAAALAEIRRVLRSGGQLLFAEHVRSDDPRLARWQDRVRAPWGVLADGCHPNRETLATIRSSGLEVERLERGELPKAPAIVRPLIMGAARKTA